MCGVSFMPQRGCWPETYSVGQQLTKQDVFFSYRTKFPYAQYFLRTKMSLVHVENFFLFFFVGLYVFETLWFVPIRRNYVSVWDPLQITAENLTDFRTPPSHNWSTVHIFVRKLKKNTLAISLLRSPFPHLSDVIHEWSLCAIYQRHLRHFPIT